MKPEDVRLGMRVELESGFVGTVTAIDGGDQTCIVHDREMREYKAWRPFSEIVKEIKTEDCHDES